MKKLLDFNLDQSGILSLDIQRSNPPNFSQKYTKASQK